MPANADYTRFEALFRQHYNDLATYACTLVNSRDDAEDVVQEVFIRIWQQLPQVIEGEGIKFYLITAVRNGCISHLRKQKNISLVEPDSAALHRPAEEARPQTGEAADPAALVQEALALLPPQCGAIFRLSRFGQLTYQQIADELGISVKTVENQMGKALKIMRGFARERNLSFGLLMAFFMGVADKV